MTAASFAQPVSIEVEAQQLACKRTQFLRGANLRRADNVRVEPTQIVLDGAEFEAPSIVAGPPPRRPRPKPDGVTTQQPQPASVLSLRQAHVANLAIADADLRACRFAGTHNLDQLSLEGAIDFANVPGGWKVGWAFPGVWRWTRRRTLAEEHQWRAAQPKRKGWYPRECRPRDPGSIERVEAAEIARLYRALRKSREDSKDEPGAADFYYGEMEMRRHDSTASSLERFVVWLYWLVCGYALRASRALFTLLAVLVGAGALIARFGFPSIVMQQRSFLSRFGTAWWSALEAAVFRSPDSHLTVSGEHIQTVVRFFGPVLLGLALLSIRGRVKR